MIRLLYTSIFSPGYCLSLRCKWTQIYLFQGSRTTQPPPKTCLKKYLLLSVMNQRTSSSIGCLQILSYEKGRMVSLAAFSISWRLLTYHPFYLNKKKTPDNLAFPHMAGVPVPDHFHQIFSHSCHLCCSWYPFVFLPPPSSHDCAVKVSKHSQKLLFTLEQDHISLWVHQAFVSQWTHMLHEGCQKKSTQRGKIIFLFL